VIRDELKALIVAAVEKARAAGDLPTVLAPVVELEHPAKAEQGDFATNVALRLQKAAGKPPRDVAGAIVQHLALPPAVSTVQVAGPGFINFFLADEWVQDQVDAILAAGPRFGHLDVGAGQRVQVEFVSANPTGPLHVGTARNAALGDSLCRVLQATGHAVEREYYFNDAGSRIEALGASVWARYQQLHGVAATFPEEGYQGEYILELARDIAAREGPALLALPPEEAISRTARLGVERVMGWIERDLADLGVRFDRWYTEQSLYDNGLFETAMQLLRERGHVAEREGAVWFTSPELGDDGDAVLVRSNGQPTYFASDVAYHFDKLLIRSYDRAIDVVSSDHQGHVARMTALVKALGVAPGRLVMLVYQMVKLFEGGQEVKMSKRAGTFVTVRDLLDAVGADAARFFLISRSADVTMNFDLDLARRQSDENPVYYVQYAHARTASILREAGERLGPDSDYADGDVRLLAHPSEMALIRKLLLFPEIVESAAATLAPHQLTFYVQDLAGTFSAFYRDCPVLPPRNPDAALAKARLKLVAATKAVLAGGLDLIGVTAPERMAERATEG
jgi:arginyl-tRNA synthetase